MKKMCIFCGEYPISKNKEHVLPQWLIAFTGDPKRVVRFGWNKETGAPREFAYKEFQFPACTKCNSNFGDLEATVKPILLRLLKSESMSTNDFVVLLDWFDKVRIGLWQAFLYLDKNVHQISPNFHIQSRLRLHDRMLHLSKIDNNEEELSFRGSDLPSFAFTPSCFSMIINNYSFINVSSPFIVSRRLGFPYPRKSLLLDSGAVDYEIVPGMGRTMKPLLRFPFRFIGTGIFQPIFQGTNSLPFYDDEYVQENSLSAQDGLGKIFIERTGERASTMALKPSTEWVPNKLYSRDRMNPGISINTIELQRFINSLSPSLEMVSDNVRKHWQASIRYGDSYGRKLVRTLSENVALQ